MDTHTAPAATITTNKRHNRIAVSIFYFCMGLCFATWASRIIDIKTALNLNEATLGSLLFMLPVGQFLAMPFSGVFVTRFGSKRVLSTAILFYACAMTFIGLATQPWHLGAFLLLFGICGNMSNISVNSQGVAVERIYARPIMASFHGAWSIAGFTGAVVAWGLSYLHLTPYQHFCGIAIIVALTVFVAKRHLVLVPPSKEDAKAKRRKFFSKPEGILFPLGIIGFCSMVSEGAMFDWSNVYFKEVVLAPSQYVQLGYASFMITMATGRFVADRFTAMFGRQKLLMISGAMISSGMYLAVAFPYLVPCILAFFLVGFGVSAVVPTVYSVAGRATETPGLALAAVTSVSYLGFLMGPPLIGWVASATSLRWSFALVGSFGFCITIIVSRFRGLD